MFKIQMKDKLMNVGELEGLTRILFELTDGSIKIGYFRKDGKIGTKKNDDSEKEIYQCGCDGKNQTFETATAIEFSENDKALKCPVCGKMFPILKIVLILNENMLLEDDLNEF